MSRLSICGTSFEDAATYAAELDLSLRDWFWCGECRVIYSEVQDG